VDQDIIEKLEVDFRALGLAEGQTVLARGACSLLGIPRETGNSAAYAFEALSRVVGPEGAICALAFTPLTPVWAKSRSVPFERLSRTQSGRFPQHMVERQDVVRSTHPTNSWVAFGKHADRIIAGHDHTARPFLPIDALLELDAQVVAWGSVASGPGVSTVHRVQEELGIDLQSPIKGLLGSKYFNDAGEEIWFSRPHTPGCSLGFGKLYKDYMAVGAMRCGQVGAAPSFAISARAAMEVDRAMIGSDPTSVLCDDDGCLVCGTRYYNFARLPVFIPSVLLRLLTGKLRLDP
jgi:aminoglycoside 3-N-acetyltransferase